MLPPLRLTAKLNPTGNHWNRASAARSAVGSPAKTTAGSVCAVIRGIRSTREAFDQLASVSGRKPNASRVADGRRTLTGTYISDF